MTCRHVNCDNGGQKALTVGDGKSPSWCITITPKDDSCRPGNSTSPARILSTIMSTMRRVAKNNAGFALQPSNYEITVIESTCPQRNCQSKRSGRTFELTWMSGASRL